VTKRDLDGDTVAELADRLPDGCMVAMVGRDGNHTVPDGDFRLQRGDHLTIIGEDRDSVHEALRQVHPDVTL
jgi:Trk K+ transport system NAD-binding subunit